MTCHPQPVDAPAGIVKGRPAVDINDGLASRRQEMDCSAYRRELLVEGFYEDGLATSARAVVFRVSRDSS